MLSDPIKLEVDPINLMVSGVFTLFYESSSTQTWFNFMWARIFFGGKGGRRSMPRSGRGSSEIELLRGIGEGATRLSRLNTK